MDPELKAHQEWLGYLQPVGLVVAPAAMQEAGWVVTRSGSELIDRQAHYRAALEPLDDTADPDDSDTEHGFQSLLDLLTEHLGWDDDQLDRSPEAIQAHSKELPELGDTLTPTAVVPAANGEGAQLLVVELPLVAAFDQKSSDADHLWRASAQERLERLLRETGVEAGLLFNGSQLRLVVAPKGESSGHLTFRLSELAEVSGRLMLSGLDLLLGQSHVFLDPDGYRLSDVLKKSRSFQAVVSNALADQVLAALWDLLRGFQQADELSQQQDNPLLGDLPERDPQQLYGGLITMLMRLVFLLYAEDEALMPSDAVYEQNYKLSAIFEQLQQDESEYPDTMEQRFGAWAGLMSLCRLVFDGGGPTVDYLPARHGQLFDPDVYPWLESPWVSDGVVLALLRNLLIVQGERISYRALDVEQIGSVYEGIMGYAVQRIPGRCIGLKSKPQGAKKQITTAVDLDVLLEMPGAKRKKWLEDEAGTTLPPKSASALKAADSEDALVEALAPRINRDLFDGPQSAGSLVFQPTEERRRSGSHYTPRSLTRPIVEEALRPWMERCEYKPTAAQILDLKICDPAMGSGAFLVESCRYLAELLEQAWTREGLPDALKPGGHALGEEPLIYARRLIAQSCLYGVDKNPFAVNLARLSLWLVSLSKDAPFTFVDHALKCGDSLVGMERSEIEAALKSASLQRELQIKNIEEVKQQEAKSFALFHADSRNDADDEQKRKALEEWNASTAYLRSVGDLLVAAFFNGNKPKDREEQKQFYLEATLQNSSAEALAEALSEPLEALREGEKGLLPLHWQLEFPDVFNRREPGFDVFVGNPPFAGNNTLVKGYPDQVLDWFKNTLPGTGGQCDLVAYFFRRSFNLLKLQGSMNFIATNTISQGDTRSSSLSWICKNNGQLYSAQKRVKWPGVAAVVVSTIGISKGWTTHSFLDGSLVPSISPFLLPGVYSEDPMRLASNLKKSFSGVMPRGAGFCFENTNKTSEHTPGTPSPLEKMKEVCNQNPLSENVIFKLIGGEDLNKSPTQQSDCYLIDFGGEDEQACRSNYPELMEIVERKVKPEREALKDSASNNPIKRTWWLHERSRPEMRKAISGLEKYLMHSFTSKYIQFAFIRDKALCSHPHNIFAFSDFSLFACLQSRVHEEWALFSCSSMKDDIRYVNTDCFETYPFPLNISSNSLTTGADSQTLNELNVLGEKYEGYRAALMVENGEGLTSTYNRFHDPAESSSGLLELRYLHCEMDKAVMSAYGWSDVPMTCGFGLDYLDTDDEVQLPDGLQERVDDGQVFFLKAEEATAFESQLRAYEAIKGKKKLPWRYRWPDDVRDDVLARLLALNAERYAEEVAQGLHSKGKKSAATASGKKRVRPAKAAVSESSEQMGLGL
ncbi:DNA methyltransferase [Synechococcus sp. RS9907]|uniref:Eco57I restriction-modification methylase domain-containing protein n=1 Tax=Synechococcus sp. RS9907 TaxID=221350 RepID=UPI00165D9564|nr:DNA methyltransferase [Synechococcus sp. RS9907]